MNEVLTFDSTHAALAAEEAILDAGYWCDIVPRPRGAESLCGLAVAIKAGDRAGITELLGRSGIDFELHPRRS